MRAMWRGIIGILIAPCMVLSAVVLPEHAHEADAHHPHTVVHRHLESHGHDAASAISDPDGPVIWLDLVAVQRSTYRVGNSPATLTQALLRAFSDQISRTKPVSYNAFLPHGPPRPCQRLRAPPIPPPHLT